MKTQTKIIKDAIEPVSGSVIDKHREIAVITCLEDCWCWSLEDDLIEAIKPLMPQKKEMPTDETTEQKIKLIDDMITHVETVINAPGAVNYGARKWEQAIKYLIKVKVEKSWDIQVLWAFLQSEEIMFEKNKLSYGTLMADPDKMLKMWMPRAHATGENNARNDISFTPTDADRQLAEEIKANRKNV